MRTHHIITLYVHCISCFQVISCNVPMSGDCTNSVVDF